MMSGCLQPKERKMLSDIEEQRKAVVVHRESELA